jgi:hypothetical protein
MIDGPVEMATRGDAALNRMQPPLPTAYGLRRCLPVLQEMQPTVWFEHSMNLQKRRVYVGNRGPLCQRLAGRLIYSQLTVFLMDPGCESGGMCRGTLLGGGCGGTPQRRAGC